MRIRQECHLADHAHGHQVRGPGRWCLACLAHPVIIVLYTHDVIGERDGGGATKGHYATQKYVPNNSGSNVKPLNTIP